jgi:hypothetical protein
MQIDALNLKRGLLWCLWTMSHTYYRLIYHVEKNTGQEYKCTRHDRETTRLLSISAIGRGRSQQANIVISPGAAHDHAAPTLPCAPWCAINPGHRRGTLEQEEEWGVQGKGKKGHDIIGGAWHWRQCRIATLFRSEIRSNGVDVDSYEMFLSGRLREMLRFSCKSCGICELCRRPAHLSLPRSGLAYVCSPPPQVDMRWLRVPQ